MMPGQDCLAGAETAHSNFVMISVVHLLGCDTVCS